MVNQAQNTLYQSESASALMDTIIDYAGIFPPTELPLEKAIHNYAQYINRNKSWMIGPFVFPVARLDELDEYMHLFTSEKPLTLSAIIKKADSEDDILKLLKKDLEKIQQFQKKYEGKFTTTSLELPLPSLDVSKKTLEKIVTLSEQYNVTCYCEVPLHQGITRDEFTQIIANFAKANNSKNQLRAKLRTGSVKRELIPEIETVASFIDVCKENKVSMKFTAGLHHPVREYREEVDGMMHGFLNVFTAGLMAYYYDLNKSKIIDILSDEDKTSFSFNDDHLIWNDLKISSTDIQKLRNYVCSFGSCNFIGPFKELSDLNIIKGGN